MQPSPAYGSSLARSLSLFILFFSFLFLFFGGERPVIVLNTCFSLPPCSSRRRQQVPFFAFIISLPLSLLKVRERRRPISARLPFCEFNSEASPALAWTRSQTPRSLLSGCRGEAAAWLGLRGAVFHIGVLFGVCNLAVGR